MVWRSRSGLFRLLVATVAMAAAACREAPRPTRTPSVRDVTPTAVPPGTLTLPNRPTSVKFAVIGDSGRGTPPQYEIAAQMRAFHERFRYPFVLMVGDNIYEGSASEEDYRTKFEQPYRELLDAGIKFYAALGNHDDPLQIAYRPFNMNGARYYSFTPPEDVLTKLTTRVEIFALDSTYLDRDQLRWAEERLAASRADWKICFFHHPLYTSGRYRLSSRAYRLRLEPLLVRHGVDAVFSGHEHIYQRTRLLSGIQYFVSGGAGSLRPGDGGPASFVARSFATDYHFMLVEIDGRALHFQAIARDGRTIDAGTLYKDERDAREDDQAAATPQGMPARR